MELDIAKYVDISRFADDYAVSCLLSKSPNLPLLDAEQRKTKAIESFHLAEMMNWVTNERFLSKKPTSLVSVQYHIGRILGPLDTSALDEIIELAGLSGGSTFDVKGKFVNSEKLKTTITTTRSLSRYARAILGHWLDHLELQVVEGNRFDTVPKSWKTDRGICIEPTLNILIQKGIGRFIRNRLKRFGVDLSDQGINRDHVKIALPCRLATIDLSMASDLLARTVVWGCLPDDWFALLDVARSPMTLIEEDWVRLEKFSSMGNGFTFELESLMFYAIALSTCKNTGLVSVYGDDIICHQDDALELVNELETFGFQINRSKSHLGGVFFESCGRHQFRTTDVTPFYMKGGKSFLDKEGTERSPVPYTLHLANAVRQYAWRRNNGVGCDVRFKPLWEYLCKQVPPMWRKPIPLEMGDTGLIMDREEATYPWLKHKGKLPNLPKAREGWEGYKVLSVKARPVKSKIFTHPSGSGNSPTPVDSHEAVLCLALLSQSKSGQLEHDQLLSSAQPYDYVGWAKKVEKLGFTYGKEPIRGLFGKPRESTSIQLWRSNLVWQ
jgi:hypothetical protein